MMNENPVKDVDITTMPESSIFTRKFEIDQCDKPLVLYQHEVGAVSCVVWDAALVLASYLQKLASESKTFLKGRRVLELGAGVGCVGLTAAALGADVVLTDLPEVVPLLEQNISANTEVWKGTGKAVARPLRWEDYKNTEESPDILLLADCIYYSESVSPLVMTMRKVCKTDTEVLVCQEQRPSEKQRATWIEFIDLLSQYFTLTRIPLSEQHPRFSSPDILILKATLIN